MPDAFPAVIVPVGFTTGFNFASASSVVSGRGCSSLSTETGSPFFCGTGTPTISSAMRPSRIAALARWWLRRANASWSSREILYSSATFSPVSGIDSVPYFALNAGLMKRQPIVVSSSFSDREKAESDLPTTNGARDMLSTPPAMTSSASPLLIARAALATASIDEPQRRFTVEPGTSTGRPGEQKRHACDVAIVFAGLIRAAVDHVVERVPIDAAIARDQCGDRNRREIVGAHGRKHAAVAADRRANCVTDVGIFHVQFEAAIASEWL